MPAYELPEDLRYTAEHEWVRSSVDGGAGGAAVDGVGGAGDARGVVRVGITAYAQGELGDIVYVSLPAVGDRVEAGTSCGELESTKSVSDLYAPLTGVVEARNEALEGSPELVNSDPYGEGWVLDLRVDDPSALDALMDAGQYAAQIT